jgi:hypothetical protein
MCHSNQGWFREQARFLRRQFLQDGDLPFSNVLSDEIVAQAEGLAVSIQQQLLRNQSPEMVAEQNTGPDGIADFGPFRPGSYLVSVRTSWKEYLTENVEHYPGEGRVEEIICPESPPFVETDVRAEVNWPDDLRHRQLWLIGSFHSKYDDFETRTIAGQKWTSPPNSAGRPNYLVLPPGGGMIGFTVDWTGEPYSPNSPYEPFHVTGGFMSRGGQFRPDGTAIMERGLRVDVKASPRQYFFGIDDLPATPEVRWPAATYRLAQVVVATNPAEAPAGAIRRLNVIGVLQAEYPRGGRGGGRGGTIDAPFGGRGNRGQNDNRDSLRPLFVTIKPDDEPQFDAVAGKTNEWKVTLPDELLAILRERLVQ